MAHQTYLSIRCHRANGEYHLFLKDNHYLQFATVKNNAINGSYRYENINNYFFKNFETESILFEDFYVQELDIDLSTIFKDGSNSIAEVRVDETFFQKTIIQPDQFKWVETGELESVKDKFTERHEIILRRLQQEDNLIDIPADLQEGIRVLKRAQSQQRLVIFAGAGISKDSGIPLWGDIKQEMLAALGSEISPGTDPTLVAQYLFRTRGNKEYNEKIRELLGYDRSPEPNAIHKAIASLQPRHIITTNFDNLLERTLASQSLGEPYALIRCDQDFPYSNFPRFLVKMHGDWNLMNFVFKEDDYLRYSQKWPLTESFVRGVFASNVVLFVGFSFEDRNLKQILDWVKNILGNDLQPAYLFMTDEKNKHERAYFEDKGLHLLSWPDELTLNLEKIGQKPTKTLSWRGAKTADFLNYLSGEKVDKYENLRKARKQSILDQMYDALRSFHAFNSLPAYFLERLFPFSPFRLSATKKQAHAESGIGNLYVKNEAIIQLMKSIDFSENQIEVKKGGPISEEVMKVEDFKSKLWYVFEKLQSSDIRCIHRDGSEVHHPIKIKSPFSEHLLFTKWFDFQVDKVLEAIEKREYAFGQPDWIPSPLRDGLLDGYVLFQLNFYNLAYDVFQKVENEAARAGDFALYFLSRRNREKTMREIYWRRFSGNYSEDFTQRIKDEADSMDLHETLRTIRVEAPVRQLLRDIQEDVVLKRFISKIEKNNLEILDKFSLFQSPHSKHFGPHYAEQLEYAFENLCLFYDTNGLIASDYSFFEKAAEKTFEGLVASHKISKRYENRYEAFNSTSLTYCARWIDPKFLTETFKKYALIEIPFLDGHKELFVTRSLNFFKSSFKDNTHFGGTSENSLFREYLKNNILFKIHEKQLFPNILRILSLVDLDDMPELATRLCDAVLKCQQNVTKNLAGADEFILFYQRHLKFFNSRQIDNIIDLMRGTHNFHHWHLQRFASRLKEVRPDYRFSNTKIFKNLLPVMTGENEQDRLLALVRFYDFLDEPFQNQLQEAIRENLNLSAGLQGLHLYFDARLAGCIPHEPFPEKVLEALKRVFGKISQLKFTPDGEIEPFESESTLGGEFPDNYVLIVSKIKQLHLINGIDEKDINWMLNQDDLPACIQWLLTPKSFDYSKFDHYWLFFLDRADVALKNLESENIPALREAIQKGLCERFSEKIAAIYFKYFSIPNTPIKPSS